MTPEMTFAGLLVSQNAEVLSTMTRVLDDFSIETDVCSKPSKVRELLSQNSIDLVVVDWDDDNSASEIVRQVNNSCSPRKPTIVAIVDQPASVSRVKQAGVHLVVQKPLTPDSSKESMRKAYSRMVRDYRRHARYAVMKSAFLRTSDGRSLVATITDISEGGVGLLTKDELAFGEVVKFSLLLPTAEKSIEVQARVLWRKQTGLAGGEIVELSPVDLRVLQDWLWHKCRIKKPMVQ